MIYGVVSLVTSFKHILYTIYLLDFVQCGAVFIQEPSKYLWVTEVTKFGGEPLI